MTPNESIIIISTNLHDTEVSQLFNGRKTSVVGLP